MNAQNLDHCQCKCHFGGAESCPNCKENHDEHIHCEKCCKS